MPESLPLVTTATSSVLNKGTLSMPFGGAQNVSSAVTAARKIKTKSEILSGQ